MRRAVRLGREVAEFPFWQAAMLLAAGGIAATLGLWVSDKSPPVTTLGVTPLNPVVAPGEALKVRYELERTRSCASRVDRVLFDGMGQRFDLADTEYAAAPGPIGRDGYTVRVDIPRSFADGSSVYRTVITYRCNLLHELWPIITRGEVPFTTKGPPVPEELPIELRSVR